MTKLKDSKNHKLTSLMSITGILSSSSYSDSSSERDSSSSELDSVAVDGDLMLARASSRRFSIVSDFGLDLGTVVFKTKGFLAIGGFFCFGVRDLLVEI